jgi:hypothetical protein
MKTTTEVTAPQSRPAATVSLNLAPAKNQSQRPTQDPQTRQDQSLQNLKSILPDKVSKAFEDNGFSGALNVIQNDLNDKELVSFAKSIEEISGNVLPESATELKKTFQSPEFGPAFITAFKASFKSAKENPQAVLNDPKEFVRSELAKLSQDPTKATVQARQAQESVSTILRFASKRDAAQALVA